MPYKNKFGQECRNHYEEPLFILKWDDYNRQFPEYAKRVIEDSVFPEKYSKYTVEVYTPDGSNIRINNHNIHFH